MHLKRNGYAQLLVLMEIDEPSSNGDENIDFLDLSLRTGLHPTDVWEALYELEKRDAISNTIGWGVTEAHKPEVDKMMIALLKRGHDKD